jgi:rhomboid protease GluP
MIRFINLGVPNFGACANRVQPQNLKMEITRVLKANWLTRKPAASAEPLTTLLALIVAVMTWMFWNDVLHAGEWMSASGVQVFEKHEYWRLWTSLFAHADPEHVVSNAILFIPLSFFLIGYFGPYFFPLFGFFVGGLVNVVALKTMTPQSSIIGISGLVYWMGSAWFTLYLLIGSRESLRRRTGKALFIAAILFAPQTFEPNVSYVAHLFGFVFGIPSALAYYAFNRNRFKAAEVYEDVIEDDDVDETIIKTMTDTEGRHDVGQRSLALISAIRDFDSIAGPDQKDRSQDGEFPTYH